VERLEIEIVVRRAVTCIPYWYMSSQSQRFVYIRRGQRTTDKRTVCCDCVCVCVTAARSTAAASGFGTVSSHGSGAGPPQLAGLFRGGMPQLRPRGGVQTDSGSSTTPRPGLHCRLTLILSNHSREFFLRFCNTRQSDCRVYPTRYVTGHFGDKSSSISLDKANLQHPR